MPSSDSAESSALITTAEVAKRLDLPVSAVRRRIHAGDIPAQKHGNIWLIQSDAIDATVS